MSTRTSRLQHQALALVQLKGGVGKTQLNANLAAIAAALHQWNVVVLDLDANAPFTGAALKTYSTQQTVRDALERTAQEEPIDNLLTFLPGLGIYLLKGDIRGIPPGLIQHIPRLIQNLKGAHIQNEDGSRPVDLVLVDTPGENREINAAVLSGVEYTAMPVLVSSPDVAALTVTLQLMARAQKERSGRPVFLGIIPNRVSRKGRVERLFLDTLLESGQLLPFIPASDTLRGTFARVSRSGGESVIAFAPGSTLARRLTRLWDALDDPHPTPEAYTEEFRKFLGTPLVSETAAEAAHA